MNITELTKGLSRTQINVFVALMDRGDWTTAYGLQCSLSTLDSLVKKGLVKKREMLGSDFGPRVNTEYKSLYRQVIK